MKVFTILALIMSFSGWSQTQTSECWEKLKNMELPDQKICVSRVAEEVKEAAKDDKQPSPEIKKMIEAIANGKFGGELAEYLKSELIKNSVKIEDEKDTLSDLIEKIDSEKDEEKLVVVIKELIINFSNEEVENRLKKIISNEARDSQVFSALIIVLTQNRPEKEIISIGKVLGFEKVLNEIVFDKKSGPELRTIGANYLYLNNKNEFLFKVYSRVEEDTFFKFILFKENTLQALKVLNDIFLKNPLLQFDILPYLMKSEVDSYHRSIFSLLSQNTSEEVKAVVLKNVFLYQTAKFEKEILALLSSLNTPMSLKNIIFFQMSGSSAFQSSILELLKSESLDLNSAKDLVCNFSNGDNEQTRNILASFLTAKDIKEELKAYSLGCLRLSMTAIQVPAIKTLINDANESVTKLLALQLLIPYITGNEIARIASGLHASLTNQQILELVNSIKDFNSSPVLKLMDTILKARQTTISKKIFNILRSDMKLSNPLFMHVLQGESDLKQDVIESVCKLENNISEYLKLYLEMNIFSQMGHGAQKSLVSCLGRHGDYAILEMLRSLRNEYVTLVGKDLVESATTAINSNVAASGEKIEVILSQIARLETNELSLEEALSLAELLHQHLTAPAIMTNPLSNKLTDDKIVIALDKINTLAELRIDNISESSIDLFYNIYKSLNYASQKNITKKTLGIILGQTGHFTLSFFLQNLTDEKLLKRDLAETLVLDQESIDQTGYKIMTSYISVRNIMTRSNSQIFSGIFTNERVQNLRIISEKKLKLALTAIATFHPKLREMPIEGLEELIDGKKDIYSIEESQIQSNSDGSNLPSSIMRYEKDLEIGPGIHHCPTSSKCTIVVNGTFSMDPFAMIKSKGNSLGQTVYTPKMHIRAISFQDIFVDLSANMKIPGKPANGAPGAATVYRSEYSHTERVCAERWLRCCVRHKNVNRYNRVEDVAAKNGANGKTGTTGNHAADLEISFARKEGKRNEIKGTITLISIGASGGEGGNGGDKGGGPAQGLKGRGGAGGNGGSLYSSELLTDTELIRNFKLMSVGGNPGKTGNGIGDVLDAEKGQDGQIHENSF